MIDKLIEERPDGTTVVYISFWRYCIFGLLFVFAFYVLVSASFQLYKELPADYWHHWNQTATLTLCTIAAALAVPFFAYWMLKGFYKKVQLEIGRSGLRYLRGGVRGGILLSENYRSINYHDVTDMGIEQQFLVNRVIAIKAGSEIHKIVLLLSEREKMRCFEVIREAVHAAGKINRQ